VELRLAQCCLRCTPCGNCCCVRWLSLGSCPAIPPTARSFNIVAIRIIAVVVNIAAVSACKCVTESGRGCLSVHSFLSTALSVWLREYGSFTGYQLSRF
jgi:hypothetical protein